MNEKDPPDGGPNNNILKFQEIELDKSRVLLDKNDDSGKYLVVNRIDPGKTMETVSAFFIKRIIDCLVGEVERANKLQDGTLLVKTKTYQQAEKLIQLIKMDANIHVRVEEHKSLNTVIGVVFCPEFIYMNDTEILQEMNDQKVIEIRRFQKKNNNGVLKDSGLYSLKFGTTILPKRIYTGYQSYKVREYIAPPLRCMNCLHFNHMTSVCKNNKKCQVCGADYHLKEDEKCQNEEKCVNCEMKHNAFSKTCPTYIREKEIKALRIKEKIGYKEAKRRYDLKNPKSGSYAEIVKPVDPPNGTNKCQCHCAKIEENIAEVQIEKSTIEKVKEICKEEDGKPKTKVLSNGNIIPPKKLNKRQKRELKKIAKEREKRVKISRDGDVDNVELESISDSESAKSG
jgi:hypothetical protein